MAGEGTTNIVQEQNVARLGLNLDNTVNQVQKGQLTYALNAAIENFDSNSVNYQNEPANEFCLDFPENYHLIGTHFIAEKNKHIFFLANPETGDSQIGYMDNNDCIYRTYINAVCLNFNINYPIHKVVHKITNCTTEIYWTDGINPRRFLDLTNLPYTTDPTSNVCNSKTLSTLKPNASLMSLLAAIASDDGAGADGGARMDVDAGLPMRLFRDDARQQRKVELMQLMGQPRRMPSMVGYGLEITGYIPKE